MSNISWDWKGIEKPLKARKAGVYEVSDLFHEGVTDDQRDQVLAVIAMTPQHKYMVLTKRAEEMHRYMTSGLYGLRTFNASWATDEQKVQVHKAGDLMGLRDLPIPNLFLGVSTENQQALDDRVPWLQQTPAAKRFISAEPLLAPLDISEYVTTVFCSYCDWSGNDGEWNEDRELEECPNCHQARLMDRQWTDHENKLDLVIAGGESGDKARPCDALWIYSLVTQCKTSGTKMHVKQLGSNVANIEAVNDLADRRRLHGKNNDPSKWPEWARVQDIL